MSIVGEVLTKYNCRPAIYDDSRCRAAASLSIDPAEKQCGGDPGYGPNIDYCGVHANRIIAEISRRKRTPALRGQRA